MARHGVIAGRVTEAKAVATPTASAEMSAPRSWLRCIRRMPRLAYINQTSDSPLKHSSIPA